MVRHWLLTFCDHASVGKGQDVYALKVTRNTQNTLLATGLSDYTIRVYRIVHGENVYAHTELKGHQGPITQLNFPFFDSPALLMSSSEDGTLCIWDVTPHDNGQVGQLMHRIVASGSRCPILSFTTTSLIGRSTSGFDIAASSRSGVVIWDRQSMKKTLVLEESFGDLVTQTVFHPSDLNILVTGGEDGLICIFDLSKGPDEDENLLAVLNTGSSVAQIGFFGPNGNGYLWCRTNIETFHVWNWRLAAQPFVSENANSGSEELFSLLDARKQLQAVCASGGFYGMQEVAYLVDCYWDPTAAQLYLVAGDILGKVALFPVASAAKNSDQSDNLVFQVSSPLDCFLKGHTDIVRDVDYSVHGSFATCGEDGKVCLWGKPVDGMSNVPYTTSSCHNKQPSKQSVTRFKPY